MTIRGVLLDFSGTLFRYEIGSAGRANRDRVQQVLVQAFTSVHEPHESIEGWPRRDLDPVVHRAVFTEVLRRGGLTEPGLAEQGYEQMLEPANWTPYPDVRAALARLRAADVPVAVVSNIAWDIRPIFQLAGVDDLVTTYVLSYLEGVVKPDEKLFRIACDRIDVDPTDALMIGDSVAADGGARAVGIAFEHVSPVPVRERPDALLAALARHGR